MTVFPLSGELSLSNLALMTLGLERHVLRRSTNQGNIKVTTNHNHNHNHVLRRSTNQGNFKVTTTSEKCRRLKSDLAERFLKQKSQ